VLAGAPILDNPTFRAASIPLQSTEHKAFKHEQSKANTEIPLTGGFAPYKEMRLRPLGLPVPVLVSSPPQRSAKLFGQGVLHLSKRKRQKSACIILGLERESLQQPDIDI
jgi:hypothetical protein